MHPAVGADPRVCPLKRYKRGIRLVPLKRKVYVFRADRFATLLSEGLGEVVCPYTWGQILYQ